MGTIRSYKINILLFARNFWILRCKLNIFIEFCIFLPWFPNFLLLNQIYLIILRDCEKKTDDIILGISKIDTLLEIRTKTSVYFILHNLYLYFLKKNILNKQAIKKSIHMLHRMIVDGIRRIYQINSAIVNDPYLELVINQIFFVRLASNFAGKYGCGQEYLINVMISIHWNYILIAWRKIEFWIPIKYFPFYIPQFLGLTHSVWQSNSFLSSISFQEISRVLINVTFYSFLDYLIRIKENCIVSIIFPIGTNRKFFNKNCYYSKSYQLEPFKNEPFFIKQKQKFFKKYHLFWVNIISYYILQRKSCLFDS